MKMTTLLCCGALIVFGLCACITALTGFDVLRAAVCGNETVYRALLSFAGVAVGHFFGARYEKPASVVGGVVLILIGLKVLLEHLGVL